MNTIQSNAYDTTNNSSNNDNGTICEHIIADENNIYTEYLGDVISVAVTFRSKLIKGRLIKITENMLILERLDKTRTLVRKSSVLGIHKSRVWDRELNVPVDTLPNREVI